MDTTPKMLPRQRETPTTFSNGGLVLYPTGSDLLRRRAKEIADYLSTETALMVREDSAVLPTRAATLPEDHREHPVVILGNLQSNRAIFPLYARYLCAADARYPGPGGSVIRTIRNPYGTGADVILVAGSCENAVCDAADRLPAACPQPTQGLPYTLDVVVSPELARRFARWPNALLDAPEPPDNRGLIEDVGTYGLMYAWTGDRRYGEIAAARLRRFNSSIESSYGDWHYFLERVLRALPWLVAGSFLTEDEVLQIDRFLLNTALATESAWWRMRTGDAPLGHRHHGKGTFEFFLIADYLLTYANPNDAARRRCLRWISECRTFLDALGKATIDDQDDETTLNNISTAFWYSAGYESMAFFESGNARRAAERAVALHDNMGAGAGQGGYGEAHGKAMYLQQEATTAVLASAFFYNDSELAWIGAHLPHLENPVRGGFWAYSPIFIRTFDAGIPKQEPQRLAGVRVLRLTTHQRRLSTDPPVHIERRGHMVNAPESWLLPEGIGGSLPPDGFDKLVLRSGFAATDAYLLLQGYQGGYRWQGQMHAANCIVRFAQHGHIFLVQNTTRQSAYHKNGLFVDNGYNTDATPPGASIEAVVDTASKAVSVSRLAPFHGCTWDRVIFYRKPNLQATGGGEDDYFVILDTATTIEPGNCAVTCSFRTPAFATLSPGRFHSAQGNHELTIQWTDTDATIEEAVDDGASRPFVLRQRIYSSCEPGDSVDFANLLTVRHTANPTSLSIGAPTHIGTWRGATLREVDRPVAWLGASADGILSGEAAEDREDIATQGKPASIKGIGIVLSDRELTVAGAEAVDIGGVSLRISVGAQRFALQYVDASLRIAPAMPTNLSDRTSTGDSRRPEVTLSLDGESRTLSIPAEGTTIRLPETAAQSIDRTLKKAFHALVVASSDRRTASSDRRAAHEILGGELPADEVPIGSTVLRPIRDATVTVDPPPIDGYQDQLLDAVLPELRESWRYWPDAQEYRVAVEFPRPTEIAGVRMVGDSIDEPFLGAFAPLPDTVSVDNRSVTGTRSVVEFRRYRGLLDHFDAVTVPVGRIVNHLDITIPGPGSDAPFMLSQLELLPMTEVPARVRHVAIGRGSDPFLVLATEANEVLAFDAAGNRQFHFAVSAPITHLACRSVTSANASDICVGLADGTVSVYHSDGTHVFTTDCAAAFAKRGDTFFGWVYSIESSEIWFRDAEGQGALAVGSYASVLFLDTDGTLLGHSWADGSWQTDICPTDDAIWVRCGWNHGVFRYAAGTGREPSGATQSFGGVTQPLFRELTHVIPFVNGRTRLFRWMPSYGGVLAVAESGMGLLNANPAATTDAPYADTDWLWKHEGGTPISAASVLESDNGDMVVIGSEGGYVSAFDVKDGEPRSKRYVGASVTSIDVDDRILVATRQSITLLDADFQIRRRWNTGAWYSAFLGRRTALAVTDRGTVAVLTLEG